MNFNPFNNQTPAQLTPSVIERVNKAVLADQRPFNPLNPEAVQLSPQVQDRFLHSRRDENLRHLEQELDKMKLARQKWQPQNPTK